MGQISINVKFDERNLNLEAYGATIAESFIKSVGDVAKRAHSEWIKQAGQRLTTSRDEYIGGLLKSESFKASIIGDKTVFEIALIGRMPNNFEFGMPEYDMKAIRPGWLGGAKAKIAKDGSKYIIIPFRHSLTSAAHLQYSGKAKREDLRSELKKTVTKYGLNRMVRSAAGDVMTGAVKRVSNKADVHSYLQGLTRIQSTVEGKTPSGKQRGSSKLMTWRVMSEKSPASSWKKKKLEAANIMPEIERWIDNELDGLMDRMFL